MTALNFQTWGCQRVTKDLSGASYEDKGKYANMVAKEYTICSNSYLMQNPFFFKLLFYYNAMPLQLLFINIGIKQTLGISSFQTQRN